MKLREFRKQRGLTARQFGDAVGLSASAVSRLETGKRTPRRTTVERIRAAYGVDLYGDSLVVEPPKFLVLSTEGFFLMFSSG